MSNQILRREFLKGGLAGAVVFGFDPWNRSWVTETSAQFGVELPPLDGALLTDPASLNAAAGDFGHIVSRQPVAVLKPGSVDDIIRMTQFARRHGLKIGARGQGHTAFGQSQVEAGIVVDMSALNTPPRLIDGRVEAGAGVMWRTALSAALAHGLRPPIVTGFLGLTVGGTLSVGGIDGGSFRFGAQVDNVLELQVVTGEGRLETCSASRKPDLFEATLAGLGQCAIIVRATLKLVPAETHARVFLLFYAGLGAMLSDERLRISGERFDSVVGFVVPSPGGGWVYFIEAAKFFTPPAMPPSADLLAGLSFLPGSEQITDVSYFDFANRVGPQIEELKANGRFNLPHPWFDVFVPDSEIDDYGGDILATLTPDDLGPDFPILFFPLKSENFTRPMLRVPDEDVFFLFDILRTAPDDSAVVDAMVASNRELFELARNLGGKHYTISAIPLSQHDWKRHFRPLWGRLVSAKSHFDPDNVLTPCPGIF